MATDRYSTREEINPGHKINMLTYIGPVVSDSRQSKSLCVCDCGKETEVFDYLLESNKAFSCGCARRPDFIFKHKPIVNPKDMYYVKKIEKCGDEICYEIGGPLPITGRTKMTMGELKKKIDKMLSRVNATGQEIIERLTKISDMGGV